MSLQRRSGLVVALDGPASGGKSTVGAAAAVELGYRFCDTGLLYRAVAWLAISEGIDSADEKRVAALTDLVILAADDRGRVARVLVGGRDVTVEMRGSAVDRVVSDVARHPAVRAALLARQREIAANGRIIMAGRDIGSVVLPDADLKIFLDASAMERGRRRALERGIDPGSPAGLEILTDLERRDTIDRTRAVAPLRASPDAHHVQTDGLSLDDTVRLVVELVQAAERVGSTAGERKG